MHKESTGKNIWLKAWTGTDVFLVGTKVGQPRLWRPKQCSHVWTQSWVESTGYRSSFPWGEPPTHQQRPHHHHLRVIQRPLDWTMWTNVWEENQIPISLATRRPDIADFLVRSWQHSVTSSTSDSSNSFKRDRRLVGSLSFMDFEFQPGSPVQPVQYPHEFQSPERSPKRFLHKNHNYIQK